MSRLYLLLFIILFTSCKLLQKEDNCLYEVDYQSNYGYKSFYIVDTITMENPVVFITYDNYTIITEKKNFVLCKDYSVNILKKEGYFLFNYGAFVAPIPILEKLHIFDIDDKYQFDLTPLSNTDEKIFAHESKKTKKFTLLLVSKNYYNRYFVALDGPPLIFDKNQNDFLYYKVLIPFLNGNE